MYTLWSFMFLICIAIYVRNIQLTSNPRCRIYTLECFLVDPKRTNSQIGEMVRFAPISETIALTLFAMQLWEERGLDDTPFCSREGGDSAEKNNKDEPH